MGEASEEDSSEFKIEKVPVHKFNPTQGESNGIELSLKDKDVPDGFKFIIKSREEKCKNVGASSFISFDSVLQKIKTPTPIASKKNNFLQVASSSTGDDEDPNQEDSSEGGGPPAALNTTADAIDYIKKALKLRLDHIEQYVKYVEDAEKMIEHNHMLL